MARYVGTQVRGIRAPIIKQGDDLVEIVVDSLRKAWESENFSLRDRDVVGITESLLARAQGNFVTADDIARDVREKFGGGEIGVVFPILSRNRFSLILKGIARAADRIILQLSYPADEVGNHLMDVDKMDELGINPYSDVLTDADYRRMFGWEVKHGFTGVDYIKLYKEMAPAGGMEIILSNDPRTILQYTKKVLTADIHSRSRTKRILKKAGAQIVYCLDDLCTEPVGDSGFNPQFGLLGSNKATEEKLKLFPRDGDDFVWQVQARLLEMTGKHVEVMIYGDGAFKDPVGKIWELADPVVSPAYTSGLLGTPNELKLKYLADNLLSDLKGAEADEAAKERIRTKRENLRDSVESQGTTPRQLTDLLGSLCDLTSGSGDKGTPIVLIQGYFDNFASE
ncbi:MAG: coenzyme F420-0:L-glutamate ligase [Clostridia bacterium]|jgi:F420-0:gamma-glutamyl ligase